MFMGARQGFASEPAAQIKRVVNFCLPSEMKMDGLQNFALRVCSKKKEECDSDCQNTCTQLCAADVAYGYYFPDETVKNYLMSTLFAEFDMLRGCIYLQIFIFEMQLIHTTHTLPMC